MSVRKIAYRQFCRKLILVPDANVLATISHGEHLLGGRGNTQTICFRYRKTHRIMAQIFRLAINYGFSAARTFIRRPSLVVNCMRASTLARYVISLCFFFRCCIVAADLCGWVRLISLRFCCAHVLWILCITCSDLYIHSRGALLVYGCVSVLIWRRLDLHTKQWLAIYNMKMFGNKTNYNLNTIRNDWPRWR